MVPSINKVGFDPTTDSRNFLLIIANQLEMLIPGNGADEINLN